MYIQKPKKLSLNTQMFIGCIFSLVMGCLLHFIYEWSGQNIIVALFAPVNESPWEHLKLLYYPILIFLIIQYIYLKIKKAPVLNLIWFTTLSILLSIAVVTVFFYTYSGILGFYIEWLNIIIFFIAVISAYLFNYNMIKNHRQQVSFSGFAGIAAIAVLLGLFILFTFYPPHIAWFQDPVGGFYGILS